MPAFWLPAHSSASSRWMRSQCTPAIISVLKVFSHSVQRKRLGASRSTWSRANISSSSSSSSPMQPSSSDAASITSRKPANSDIISAIMSLMNSKSSSIEPFAS